MLYISKVLGQAAAALLLAGSAAISQAAVPISFLYNGNGTISSVPCGPACLDASVVGVANDWAGMSSPIPGSWDVTVSEHVDLATGTFTGTFAYTDASPSANSFAGTVAGTFTPLGPTHIKVESSFTVTGGTGLFTGATGTGMNTVYADLAKGEYVEAGMFDVMAVPEPTTLLMLGAGLFVVGAIRLRRA